MAERSPTETKACVQVCFGHCFAISLFFNQSLMRSDQKKLINFEKHFRKLHVNNSFVLGSEVSRLLLIHFWFHQDFKSETLALLFTSFPSHSAHKETLTSARKSCSRALVYFSGPPKLRLGEKKKRIPKCCLKI